MGSYKFKDGTLLLGAGPSVDFSAQVRSLMVKWTEEVETIDAIPLLDATEIPEEEEATYKATLSGKFLQDLALNGIVDWSWKNRGLTMIFRFIPDDVTARGAEGNVRIVPVDVGGDITKPANRPESDFEWKCVGGLPIFGPAAAGDVSEDV